MFKRIKSILFVVGVVMIFTAQTNPPDERKEQGAPKARPAEARPAARPAAARPAAARPAARTAPVARNNQSRPQVQVHNQAPRQAVRTAPVVESRIAQPSYQGRQEPRVYATPAPAPVTNNRFLNRQHHNNWQPLYNYYDNQYHFYPYVNVTSPVQLSADCVAVLFNGQTYYYDRGSFYVQDPQGYLAVAPPIGIIVPAIPANARQINVDGQIYYRKKGIFYVQVPQGFQVVGPVQPDPEG